MASQQQPTSDARDTISDVILSERGRAIIAAHLPPGVSMELVAGEVARLWYEKPEIHECTAISIVRAVAKGVSWNLTLGEKWHLVPFNQKVKLANGETRWESRAKAILDYKGMLDLLYRYGAIRSHRAKCVYANEPYRPLGTAARPDVEHFPGRSESERGELQGAYFLAYFDVMGHGTLDYMTAAEGDRVRVEHSKSWNTKKVGNASVAIEIGEIPWYLMKTLVRRLWKQLAPRMERSTQFGKQHVVLDDEESPDVVDADAPESAMLDAGFRALAPGSSEERRMLTAGPAQLVETGRRNPGARAPLTSNSFEPEDPYGLDAVKVMQSAQVQAKESRRR